MAIQDHAPGWAGYFGGEALLAEEAAGATPLRVPDESPVTPSGEESRRFYEGLEQRGELIDVEEPADTTHLPPHVTHVRHKDGTVERIGFSITPPS